MTDLPPAKRVKTLAASLLFNQPKPTMDGVPEEILILIFTILLSSNPDYGVIVSHVCPRWFNIVRNDFYFGRFKVFSCFFFLFSFSKKKSFYFGKVPRVVRFDTIEAPMDVSEDSADSDDEDQPRIVRKTVEVKKNKFLISLKSNDTVTGELVICSWSLWLWLVVNYGLQV